MQGSTNELAKLSNHCSQVQVSYCISTEFIGILDMKFFFFFAHKLTALFQFIANHNPSLVFNVSTFEIFYFYDTLYKQGCCLLNLLN